MKECFRQQKQLQLHVQISKVSSSLEYNSNNQKQKQNEKIYRNYHAPADAQISNAEMTPAQQAKGMEMWINWAKKCGDKLVDLGAPLANGLSLTPAGSSASNKQVSDILFFRQMI